MTYWPCALTSTLTSLERSICFSALAAGRLICSSVYFEYVVVIMRKIRITSMTSIIGTRLISSGSFSLPRWKFMLGPLLRRLEVHALAVHDVDEAGGLLLHLHHLRVDLVLEMAVEDERGNGDGDAECGVVERNRDAVRELLRVGPGRPLRAEDLDHADHRAEQAEQRRGGGDGPQRREKTLQVVRYRAARFVDGILHHIA